MPNLKREEYEALMRECELSLHSNNSVTTTIRVHSLERLLVLARIGARCLEPSEEEVERVAFAICETNDADPRTEETNLRADIETRVRTLAHSMPPSDFGSTRAIYGIVDLILNERAAALEEAMRENEKLKGVHELFGIGLDACVETELHRVAATTRAKAIEDALDAAKPYLHHLKSTAERSIKKDPTYDVFQIREVLSNAMMIEQAIRSLANPASAKGE